MCYGRYTVLFFFFSSRRRHTRLQGDWSSDVCSSDLEDTRRLAEAEIQAAVTLDPASAVYRTMLAELYFDLKLDRKSVVKGKSVDLGGRRIIKKKKKRKLRISGHLKKQTRNTNVCEQT